MNSRRRISRPHSLRVRPVMAKTSTLRPIDEWEMAPNRSQTQSGSMSQLGHQRT